MLLSCNTKNSGRNVSFQRKLQSMTRKCSTHCDLGLDLGLEGEDFVNNVLDKIGIFLTKVLTKKRLRL